MDISANFLLFVVVAAFTPGPNNIMIMTSGLNHGIKASLPHLLGIAVGVPTMLLAVGFGLMFVFSQWPLVHVLIQVLGIFYLLYLAWLIATSAPSSLDGSAQRNKPLSFIQAALFQWINPKTWMMGTGAIAAYTQVGADTAPQIMMMALVFCLMAFPSAGSWMVFGSWLKRVFKNPRHQVWFNRTMAVLLVLSIMPVIKGLLENTWL